MTPVMAYLLKIQILHQSYNILLIKEKRLNQNENKSRDVFTGEALSFPFLQKLPLLVDLATNAYFAGNPLLLLYIHNMGGHNNYPSRQFVSCTARELVLGEGGQCILLKHMKSGHYESPCWPTRELTQLLGMEF